MSDQPIIAVPTCFLQANRTAHPASPQELCSLVRDARHNGQALYAMGGGTMIDLGYAATQPGWVVHTSKLDQVLDYPARDMTITLQAGITIARLQETLQTEKQQLPVDIPFPDRATLGGAIATNASGPRRYGLGTLRDYVIGITVVNDEGQEVKGGGRVVKNVAGYDLMKLYTGSLGTLGIITQVTLKLKPLPEAAALVMFPVDAPEAASLLDLLHRTRTRPDAIELLTPETCRAIEQEYSLGLLPAEAGRGCLVVDFEDNFKAVGWQVDQLKLELPARSRDALRECSDAERTRLSAILRDFPLWPSGTLTFKANLLPSAVSYFCALANDQSPTPLIQAHAGNGIIIGHLKEASLDQARSLLEKLGTFAANAKGSLIVTRCPAEWKTVLPIWGRPAGDRAIMKAIKAKLDPGNIFNPGRFVDGI